MDWTQYDQLKAQGLADREIARQWGIVWSTLHREKQKREPTGVTVPENQGENTNVHYSTPTSHQWNTKVHQSTPNLPAKRPTTIYPSTPVEQSTKVHYGVPIPNDAAMRLLSLLADLDVIVARERDRQRLLSTPIGTPRHRGENLRGGHALRRPHRLLRPGRRGRAQGRGEPNVS
jgi:hypothetical protein